MVWTPRSHDMTIFLHIGYLSRVYGMEVLAFLVQLFHSQTFYLFLVQLSHGDN